MTDKQVELLKRCIRAVRYVDEHRENWSNTHPGFHMDDFEMVEVGWINGVNPRTAKSLVEMGLLEECMPYDSSVCTSTHVRLPKLKSLDKQEQP